MITHTDLRDLRQTAVVSEHWLYLPSVWSKQILAGCSASQSLFLLVLITSRLGFPRRLMEHKRNSPFPFLSRLPNDMSVFCLETVFVCVCLLVSLQNETPIQMKKYGNSIAFSHAGVAWVPILPSNLCKSLTNLVERRWQKAFVFCWLIWCF